MQTYHVLVVYKSVMKEKVVCKKLAELDLTPHDLNELIVKSYNSGQAITVCETLIAMDDIVNIRITKPKESSWILRQRAEQSRYRQFLTHEDVDRHIVNCGEDVTDQFLTDTSKQDC